jgi:NtrC-family two-component system sensor histidine kinase KinB
MGVSIQKFLDDDYTSINAATTMIEALEREDSGTLLLLSGKWEEGRSILASADSLFEQGFLMAQKQESIAEEKDYLDSIRSSYGSYRNQWIRPVVGTQKEGDLDWYFQDLHQAFLDAKSSVNDLLIYNDRIMYLTATDLRNRSNRAIMPGIVAVGASLIFTLIFHFFVNYYVVSPLVRIKNSVNQFIDNKLPFNVEIETDDEISELAAAVGRLCLRVHPQEQKE